jgi:hypothetical protein
MDGESPSGSGKGHPISALFRASTNEKSTPTVFELSCKLELHLRRAIDDVHSAEFNDDAALEQTLLDVTTNITEIIRDIRSRLKK